MQSRSPHRVHFPLFLAVPVLLALVGVSCAGASAQPAAPPAAPRVTVAAALERDLTEWDELTGRLEAVNTVDVRPRVSGYVSAVHFREGAIVARGDLLFTIDARPFQADVDRLQAELTRARATVGRADSELARADRLARENAISSEEHDRRAAFALESRAQQDAMDATLRAAALELEFTRVTAPIAGRIGRAIVTEGNLVSSGPGEATLLAVLVSLDPIYATFDADEQTYRRIAGIGNESRRGSGALPIRMSLGADGDYPYAGQLTFLDNRVDPSTGTIRARALFRNADLNLTPGLFVRLRVPLSGVAKRVLIQDRAVGTDLDKRFVLVVEEGSVAYRPVALGPIVDGLRVVREGVAPGDLVLVSGTQHVRPGMTVQPDVVSMDEVRP